MLKKIISLSLALIMVFTLGTTAFAASTVPTSVDNILEGIIEYSSYNYQTGKWDLDHAIVDDGILTEVQYNDAEEIGDYYAELFVEEGSQSRALPAAVVLVLKAIAAAGGAALAAEIVSDIYNYGMTVACENFTGVALFQDFCETNGYI